MKLHELKATHEHFPKYANDTWSCRNNDRGFKTGDLVSVYHITFNHLKHIHIIKKVNKNIPGVDPNYVILDLQLLQEFA